MWTAPTTVQGPNGCCATCSTWSTPPCTATTPTHTSGSCCAGKAARCVSKLEPVRDVRPPTSGPRHASSARTWRVSCAACLGRKPNEHDHSSCPRRCRAYRRTSTPPPRNENRSTRRGRRRRNHRRNCCEIRMVSLSEGIGWPYPVVRIYAAHRWVVAVWCSPNITPHA